MSLISRFKFFLSYIYPIRVEVANSPLHPYMAVELFQGKYLLNGKNVNYSNGELYQVFDRFFEEIQVQKYTFNNILILGLGAGSVLSILRNKHRLTAKVTGVEADNWVLYAGKKYFGLNDFNDVEIIQEDAKKFCEESQEKFDFIVVDIFINDLIPDYFQSKEFMQELYRLSNTNVLVVFNTMSDTEENKMGFAQLKEKFRQIFGVALEKKIYISGAQNTFLYCLPNG